MAPVNMHASHFDVANVDSANMLMQHSDLARLAIGIGDEVFTMGLFASAQGSRRNMPIVRHGHVAMIPEDMIPTKMGDARAYLIEAHSFGGLSGAPVFVKQTIVPVGLSSVAVQMSGPWWLLGLMHGHWDIDAADVNAHNFRSPENAPGINLGIAIVIPAYQIAETLNQPALMKQRADVEEREISRGDLPVADGLTLEDQRTRGPEPERLTIRGDWGDAVKRALKKSPKNSRQGKKR